MTIAFVRRGPWLRRVAAGTLLLLGPGPAGAQQRDGTEFVVNSYTTGGQYRQRVARQADGSFLVVWSGPGQGDPDGGVLPSSTTPAGRRWGASFA
jgi:hypothetical protein